MGMGQCTACKDYYYPSSVITLERDLSNSQSSAFKNFKNPFFPKVTDINDFLVNTDNNARDTFDNINREEGKEKRKEELNILKNEIFVNEKKSGINIINNIKDENNIIDKNNNISNSLDDYNNINNIKEENSNLNQAEKIENLRINQTLENMCIIGNVMKKDIIEEKKANPEKFIETDEALQLRDKDEGFFVLGLISKNLEDIGVVTAIEKETNEDEQDSAENCLQYICNGLVQKKKYNLYFDFDEERIEELLEDKNEFEIFKNNLLKKLSKDYQYPEDKIIVTFPQKGSFHVQVIFQSNEFNDLNLDEFKQKFKNDDEFKELINLKEIHSDIILGGCKLTKKLLDEKGNRNEGFEEGGKRGGRPYNPPNDWIEIGLKVMDKYENNDWIGCDNNPGEWCVAYHGIGRYLESGEIKDITDKIIKGEFKPGTNQVHKNCENMNKPGTKVGEGVYCTPNIDNIKNYSGISEINGKSYQTVLMVRVKPDAIRECLDSEEYWVVNGTEDEIRPYKILYKCL